MEQQRTTSPAAEVVARLEAAICRWTSELAGARHDARYLPTSLERDCALEVAGEFRWAIREAKGMLLQARAAGAA